VREQQQYQRYYNCEDRYGSEGALLAVKHGPSSKYTPRQMDLLKQRYQDFFFFVV
jgi:hypothetical protein